jgi:DNA end-binding protein Ku
VSRPIWKGHISFGLVNVPVILYSAESRANISFKLIDSRDSARIRYERINEDTGEEVPWNRIVKGYEYDDGNYVLLSEEELERASAELTRTVEIEQFVDVDDISPIYFERPYYLVPDKGGEKGYALLRTAMANAGKIGIALIVIRARQYLSAMMPVGDLLVLNLMRFHQEIRDIADFDIPASRFRDQHISKKEMELAGQLIEGMSGDWDAKKYQDEYRAALMEMIQRKIDAGEFEPLEVPEEEEEDEEPATINLMDVLRQSIETKGKSGTRTKAITKTRRKTKPKTKQKHKHRQKSAPAAKRKTGRKKKAG